MNNIEKLVDYHVSGRIGHIRLARPDKLNALTPLTYARIGELIARASADAAVRVIVVGAEGRAFAAGADIEQYIGLSEEDFGRFIDESRAVIDTLAACPKPIVAAVQGFALGGGFELALACDLIVAADNARFGLPEARLGLLPGGGGTQRLPRLVGRMRANELILTGRFLSADEALSWGIVNRVCDKEELEATVDALVAELLVAAPAAQGFAKGLIAESADVSLRDGLLMERDLTAPLIDTADAREGINAFAEKREPRFGDSR